MYIWCLKITNHKFTDIIFKTREYTKRLRSLKDARNTNSSDADLTANTYANGNGNKNKNDRKDTVQPTNQTQTKTVETHTLKIKSIKKGVTFTQAVGEKEKNDSARSYDNDGKICRRGHRLIEAHGKDTTQLPKKQSSRASNYDIDIATDTIAPKERLATKKTDPHGSRGGHDHDRSSDGTSTKRSTVLTVTGKLHHRKVQFKTVIKNAWWDMNKMNSIVFAEGGKGGDYILDKIHSGDYDLHIINQAQHHQQDERQIITMKYRLVMMILVVLVLDLL